MRVPRETGYKPGLLALFDNTIAYIVTAVQGGNLGREQVRVKIWAANDAQ